MRRPLGSSSFVLRASSVSLAALTIFACKGDDGPGGDEYVDSGILDVDSLDPAFAPGTGTPEPGGIASVDLLRMVRQLAIEHDVVGIDVVEVAPAYDVSDLTVNVAHRLVFEALGGMAERRRRAAEG